MIFQILQKIGLVAFFVFVAFMIFALSPRSKMVMFEPPAVKWLWSCALIAILLLLFYRQHLMHLHRVYMDDAKITGRPPFPALRR